MIAYVTQTYDFHTALQAGDGLYDVVIDRIEHINDNKAMAYTNYGRIFLESFEDRSGTIYMKVMPVK